MLSPKYTIIWRDSFGVLHFKTFETKELLNDFLPTLVDFESYEIISGFTIDTGGDNEES